MDGAKHFFVVAFQLDDESGSGQWIGGLERAGPVKARAVLLGPVRSVIQQSLTHLPYRFLLRLCMTDWSPFFSGTQRLFVHRLGLLPQVDVLYV